MKLSLLSKLSGELPRGGYRGGRRRRKFSIRHSSRRIQKRSNRLERLREVRYWLKEHLREIEELREGGYSWRQIMHATDRTGLFDEQIFTVSQDTGKILRKWLDDGAEIMKGDKA